MFLEKVCGVRVVREVRIIDLALTWLFPPTIWKADSSLFIEDLFYKSAIKEATDFLEKH